jgi:hypothetical protein
MHENHSIYVLISRLGDTSHTVRARKLQKQ